MSRKRHKLLRILDTAGPEDLAAVEAELALRRADVARLERVREVLIACVGDRTQEPAPAPPAQPTPVTERNGKPPTDHDATELEEMRLSVVIYLAKEGSQPAGMIRSGCEIPGDDIDLVMDCDWFFKESGLWCLTVEGRAVARREMAGKEE